jgi:hypothetical protein
MHALPTSAQLAGHVEDHNPVLLPQQNAAVSELLAVSYGPSAAQVIGSTCVNKSVPAGITPRALPCICPSVCRDGAEQLSVDRALRALSRAEVVVMVVDGSEGVTQQVGVPRQRPCC